MALRRSPRHAAKATTPFIAEPCRKPLKAIANPVTHAPPSRFDIDSVHIQISLYNRDRIVLPTRETLWNLLGDPPYIGCSKVNLTDLFELMYWRRLQGLPLPRDANGVSVKKTPYLVVTFFSFHLLGSKILIHHTSRHLLLYSGEKSLL